MEVAASKDKEKGSREFKGNFEFGDNLKEARQLWGDEVVFNLFIAKAKIKVQDAVIRPMLKDDKTDAEITEALSTYRLDAEPVRTKKSKQEKANELWAGLTDDEKKALMAKWGIGG